MRGKIVESIAKFLLVWCAVITFTLFLGLYLGEGQITFYEYNPIIRLAELIIYSGVLGFSIYLLANFIRRH